MSFEQGAGFRAAGCVVRKFCSPTGKFGALTLSITQGERNTKVDFVTFDCVNDFSDLVQGANVTVTGKIGMNKLTAKDKSEVKVDGFAKWVPQLVVTAVKVEASSKKPAASPDSDDVTW
jgi:hypothetical protein